MADSLTQYSQKATLDHLLGIAAFTMPTNIYLAAFTADPGETGSTANEVAATGYARLEITGLMSPTALGTGISTNTVAVTFPAAEADWGAVSHMAIMDAPTGGNMLAKNAMGSTRTINTGDVLDFAIGAIQGRMR